MTIHDGLYSRQPRNNSVTAKERMSSKQSRMKENILKDEKHEGAEYRNNSRKKTFKPATQEKGKATTKKELKI